jgi:hypothetical protein
MLITEPVFFDFESDFVASLRCIPMVVRYKLDTCGIKLKLEQWNHFNSTDRQQLAAQPCNTPDEILQYRQDLINLIQQRTQTAASELPIEDRPDWMQTDSIPVSVREKAESVGTALEVEQWRSLDPLQRFALIKLSRSSHENRNFEPALKEFQLATS